MVISIILNLSFTIVLGETIVKPLTTNSNNPLLFTHQQFIDSQIDKISKDNNNPMISTQKDKENRTFGDCYSGTVGSLLLASMFTPYTIDLNDPEMKKFLSNFCNFYFDKAGIWINIRETNDLTTKYGQEFYNKYGNTMPESLKQFYEYSEQFSKSEDIARSNNMTPLDNVAILETSLGNITLELFPQAAPKHVNSFLNLSKTGFYDGTIFHRIVKDFVIQGGDPSTKNTTQKDRWGTGGPGFTLDAEFNDIPHERGIVSMARTADPNSAGSQFFIVTKDSRFLDNQYTVFGRVIDGMDVVDKIEDLPTNKSSDQPIDFEDAKVQKVIIEQIKDTK